MPSRSGVASPDPVRPLYSRRATAILLSVAVAVAALAVAGVAAAMGWARSPYSTMQYADVRQPVPFSHQIHVTGLQVDCRYCHSTVDREFTAGIPPTRTCVGCHNDAYLQSALFEPVRRSLETGAPIQWRRVNNLPDFVFFNHASHVTRGVQCATCHGDVGQMAQLYQARPLTMKWCLDCHRDPSPYLRPGEGAMPRSDSGRPWPVRAGTPDSIAGAVARLTACSTCHR